jgi:glycerol-3-phosphate dehydrogenase
LSLDDVLARRTRLAQELPDRGAAVAPRVARILGAELDWDERHQAAEIETYLSTARREFSVAAPEPSGAVELAPLPVD